MNLVPGQYREVSVAEVPVPLTAAALSTYLTGRDVYRRTRYVIARRRDPSGDASGDASAVAEVTKQSEQPLFSPVTTVRLLARPDETALVDAPDTDTGVPTQLARVALTQAPGARCVIVRGRYGHVNFILDPAPIRVRVLEVVPPWPPKLVDQLTRVLDLAEDLPPVELVPELVDLRDLADRLPAERYLFPCRAGQASHDQETPVSYLDEVPEREPWTLVGCARSRGIHDWFYGGDVPMVDMCPRNLAAAGQQKSQQEAQRPPGPLITKCCLLEDRVAADGNTVVVPWGASLAQIREGLTEALALAADPVPR